MNKQKEPWKTFSKTQSVAAQQLFPTGTIIAYARALSSILVKKISKNLYQLKHCYSRLKNDSVIIDYRIYAILIFVVSYGIV